MSKYAPLEEYLTSQTERSITLTFEEMENLLGFKLPDSAYKHRAWWSNGKKTGSKFWLRVGWEVHSVHLGKDVSFRKFESQASSLEKLCEELASDVQITLDLADIPDMILNLRNLLLEGIITQEEFDEKKEDLLSLI